MEPPLSLCGQYISRCMVGVWEIFAINKYWEIGHYIQSFGSSFIHIYLYKSMSNQGEVWPWESIEVKLKNWFQIDNTADTERRKGKLLTQERVEMG